MKALIIEDSELARRDLRAMLAEHPAIEIIGEASHPDEAEILINKTQPDLLFLDIHMPGRSGFELLECINQHIKVVFTTAYMDLAIRSFEYNTVDYLVKPISPKKLARAVRRLRCDESDDNTLGNEEKILSINESIFARDGDDCYLIPLSNIERFDSHGNYSRIYFFDEQSQSQQSIFLYKSLTRIEARLPNKHFFRNNRQQIINVSKVCSVNVWINAGLKISLKSGIETEVSRRNTARFKKLFSI
jgi:two-component system LytT family response regulator